MKAIREWVRIRIIYLVLKWMERYRVAVMTMNHIEDEKGTRLVMIGINHKDSNQVHFDYFERVSGKRKYSYTLSKEEIDQILQEESNET